MLAPPICQSKSDSINNPSVTENIVQSRFTKSMPTQTFGDHLRERLKEKGMKPAELARRSGVTKQNISRLLHGTPHSITGAPPRAEPDTVKKLAKALGWNANDALLAAGYAPDTPSEGYEILNEFLAALAHLPPFTDEEKRQFFETMRLVAQGIKNEQGKDTDSPSE
jgi:transcriptional regulator with XRE-family HTH domain